VYLHQIIAGWLNFYQQSRYFLSELQNPGCKNRAKQFFHHKIRKIPDLSIQTGHESNLLFELKKNV